MGARLDFPQTGFNQSLFAREAKKVIIDIDPFEIKKFKFTIDHPVYADVLAVIKELQKNDTSIPEKTAWLKQCAEWRNTYTVVLPEHYQKKDYASLYVLAVAITSA
jgi:acetolactate synthase-1/2/3 large subunit